MDSKSFTITLEGIAKCIILCDANEYMRPSEILSKYLNQITGAKIEIEPKSSNHQYNKSIVFVKEDCGEAGFAVRIENDNLLICAKDEQSAVYGVYEILEKYAKCRFYTSNVENIPHNPTLVLEIEPYQYTPVFAFRELYYRDYENKEFAEKHKLSPSEQHEGWGFWCHSFNILLPSELYDEHPEYFALIDGERKRNAQPCLSNPEVFEIMYKNLKKHMEQKPQAKYWSLSQDDNADYCRCSECKAIDDRDGVQMGSILTFVNKMAEKIPEKVISTLAYWYSRKPPLVTRPGKNVHIMLCNIEAGRGKPIETDTENEGSKNELLEWAKICGNVFLWDYCIQFANLVSPFPNLRVLAPNMRFFAENNVRYLFSQCNREKFGEFAELRGYMLAKLMWNPYANDREIMIEFLDGYYGEAGKYLLAYIDQMHDKMDESGKRLDIFGGPKSAKDTYLTRDLFDDYSVIFDNAEAAVSTDAELLARVEYARLPLYYAGIVNLYGEKQELIQMLTKFATLAKACGLEKVEEWKITVEKFVTASLIEIGKEINGVPVNSINTPRK